MAVIYGSARAILAIDEGTSGTRAALVTEDGEVGESEYRSLSAPTVRGGAVETDANEIWAKTLDAILATLRRAHEQRIEVVGVAISNQRATAVLWNRHTGEALVPSATWQDTRYATELAEIGSEWNPLLKEATGRTAGLRSPFLWAAGHLRDTREVAAAYAAGELGFGTVESWLIWNLTGGSAYVTTATNVCATGAYHLARHSYLREWTERMGFPADLLPELHEDGTHLGVTDQRIVGVKLPIVAALGDQLAGIIGLGGVVAGDVTCIHGTGSFVDVAAGTTIPQLETVDDSVVALLGWRECSVSSHSIEAFTPSTGSALNWLCSGIGLFDSPTAISDLASTVDDARGTTFIPSLAGLRNPVASPTARGSFVGLSLGTTKAQLARSVLEGIAHSTADSTEAARQGSDISSIRTGGGISASNPLVQLQADLIGVPVLRLHGSAFASLRGAALLGGSRGLFWDSLTDAIRTLRVTAEFSPQISADEREYRRESWRQNLELELDRAPANRSPKNRNR